MEVDDYDTNALVKELYKVEKQSYFRPICRCSDEKPPMDISEALENSTKSYDIF